MVNIYVQFDVNAAVFPCFYNLKWKFHAELAILWRHTWQQSNNMAAMVRLLEETDPIVEEVYRRKKYDSSTYTWEIVFILFIFLESLIM